MFPWLCVETPFHFLEIKSNQNMIQRKTLPYSNQYYNDFYTFIKSLLCNVSLFFIFKYTYKQN